MQPTTLERGWPCALLSVLVLLCIFSAAIVAAVHFHHDAQVPDDPHCSLCMLQSTLVAVVVTMALCVFLQLLMFTKEHESELPGFVVFRITLIRPPPSTQLFSLEHY
jgi:hypothetical protein